MKKRFLCILLSAAVLMPSVPVFAADLTNTISAEEKNDTESAEEEQSAYTLEETDGLDETEGMQNGEEQKKENSWRYSDGELIPDKERAVYSNDAWTKVDGYFINNVGEAIPNAVKKGIDVSHHQGAIDWNEVKNSDVEFVIIRCGYGDNVASQDDKQWLTNVEACERLGIPYGVYLYSYATTEAQARSEAEHALRLLKGHNPTYPVYYDMEDDSTLASSSQFAEFAEIFCSTIEAAGYEAGVYANLFWWNTYLTDERFAQWDRWVAQYNSQCDYQGVYSMWQCTSSGRVPGIEGFADINFQMSEIGQWYEKDGHKYYYLNGKMLQDQGYKIDGYWYYFGSEGEMYCAEWREKAGEMYYYDESGHLVSNQGLKIDGYWYYFGSSGAMYCSEWREKAGEMYYYDENGHLAVNTGLKIDGYWYYFGSSGAMYRSEWREKAGEMYYYDENGRLTVNTGLKIDGYWYYFGSSGAMYCAEWREKAGEMYYYDENGRLTVNTGLKIDGYWYYFGSSGAMYRSEWREKAGKMYYYDENGHLSVNVGLKIDGYWYYFGSSGAMYCSEWREKAGDMYYYDENGHLVTGTTIIIDENTYTFSTSGKLEV